MLTGELGIGVFLKNIRRVDTRPRVWRVEIDIVEVHVVQLLFGQANQPSRGQSVHPCDVLQINVAELRSARCVGGRSWIAVKH